MFFAVKTLAKSVFKTVILSLAVTLAAHNHSCFQGRQAPYVFIQTTNNLYTRKIGFGKERLTNVPVL